MGQDFTKGLNVCIGNYGYYNEGSLHDAWITLPKTEAEIRDFLHLNQLQDSQHEEIYISDYDGIPFGTRLLFNEFCHLEDLNLLAKQLVTANPVDLEKVGAWIQANDTPESLVGLMNLIEQADDIPFYSWGYDGAYDKDEFGTKRRTAAWDINRKSAAMPPNCSMTGNRLWRLHPRSINRRKAYGAIPGKSLARINVRGTFSL